MSLARTEIHPEPPRAPGPYRTGVPTSALAERINANVREGNKVPPHILKAQMLKELMELDKIKRTKRALDRDAQKRYEEILANWDPRWGPLRASDPLKPQAAQFAVAPRPAIGRPPQ